MNYKYFIIVPLAIAEGHLISLICGFLAKAGYLNPFLSAILIILGNLLGDVSLYWIGFHKGEKVVGKFGKFMGITQKNIDKTKIIFNRHHAKILFFSKITNGFGMAMAVLFTAGMSHISFLRYLFWNIIGEIIWTGSLVFIGYSLGSLFYLANNIILRFFLIFAGGVILFMLFIVVKKYIKKKL